jgi:Ca2+-binding RTX toxin-like protein
MRRAAARAPPWDGETLMNNTRTLRTAAALLLAATFAPAAAVPATASGETCDGKVATIFVPPAWDGYRTDPVTGTPGDDVIVGTTWSDTIDGAGGDDTICGFKGDDHLLGGVGRDRLFGGLDQDYVTGDGYDGDVIDPGPGNDYVDLGHDPQGEDLWWGDSVAWDRVSYRSSAGPVEVDLVAGTATGEGTDTIAPIVHAAGIEGSAYDDVLLGSPGPDWIAAGGGDDFVDARGGHDQVMADDLYQATGELAVPGDDVVMGGPGSDNLSGGGGSDRVYGGTGHDSIGLGSDVGAKGFGGGGGDQLHAGGRARVAGGRGPDWFDIEIRSHSDRVRVAGGAGSDSIELGLAVDLIEHRLVVGRPTGTVRVRGGPELVRFASLDGFGLVSDHPYSVTWYGTAADDHLDLMSLEGQARAFGRGGDDQLRGGQGNDHLDGGPGRDRLEGSSGDDVCLRGERLRSCEITY